MFDKQRKKVWFSTGLGALLLAAIALEWLHSSPVMEATIPPTAIAFLLWIARVAYLWQRRASYERREVRRRTDPAEPADIPAWVPKAEDYEGGGAVNATQQRFLEQAVEAQGTYFANGILAALLPPLALLLLSLQILVFPSGGGWAFGLIFSEALCLLMLVNFAWTHPEPTADWIEHRVRAELLRREQYLMVAGIGPYLLKTPPEIEQEAMVRLGLIKGAATQDLTRLILLQEGALAHWLESLHRGGAASLSPRADLRNRIATCLYRRVTRQLQWFANEVRDCRENERTWTHMLKAAVLAAFLVAIVHGGRLLSSLGAVDPASPLSLATTALGVLLPPIGTTLLSIKSMYAFDARRRLYQRTERLLHEYRGLMESLLAEAGQIQSGTAVRPPEEIELDFRATVLRVEQTLSFELEQWLLLTHRTEHEVSA